MGRLLPGEGSRKNDGTILKPKKIIKRTPQKWTPGVSRSATVPGYRAPKPVAPSKNPTFNFQKSVGLDRQQHIGAQKVRKANRKTKNPLPYLPHLAHYTAAQRAIILRSTGTALKNLVRNQNDAGTTQAGSLQHYGTKQERDTVGQYEGALRTDTMLHNRAIGDAAKLEAAHQKAQADKALKETIAAAPKGRVAFGELTGTGPVARLMAASREQDAKAKKVLKTNSVQLGAQMRAEVATKPGPRNVGAHAMLKRSDGGSTQTGGIFGTSIPGLKQLDWTAGSVLNQFSRPLQAVGGAMHAVDEHKGVMGILSAAGKSFEGRKGSTYFPSDSNVAQGFSGAGKLGVDLALDPLNFVGGELVAPEKIALREASALREGAEKSYQAAGQAADAGDTAKARKLMHQSQDMAKKAEARARDAHGAAANKGFSVHLKVPFNSVHKGTQTSGKASAATMSLLRLGDKSKRVGTEVVRERRGAATAIRESKYGQALGSEFAPHTFIPKNVDPAKWKSGVEAHNAARAQGRMALKKGENVGLSFLREIQKTTGHKGGLAGVLKRVLPEGREWNATRKDLEDRVALATHDRRAADARSTAWSPRTVDQTARVRPTGESVGWVDSNPRVNGNATADRVTNSHNGAGHMGTGVEFHEHPNRTAGAVPLDLSGLRLAKPDSPAHALSLQRALSDINRAAREGKAPRDLDTIVKSLPLPKGVTEDAAKRVIVRAIEGTNKDLAAAHRGLDTAATRAMRDIGWDGIDTRGLGLSERTHPSVIFRHPDVTDALREQRNTRLEAVSAHAALENHLTGGLTSLNRRLVDAVEQAPKNTHEAVILRRFWRDAKNHRLNPVYSAKRGELEDAFKTGMGSSREDRAAARKTVRILEASEKRNLTKAGTAQGRAEILSRNVTGSESAAKRGERYAGGALGVREADTNLETIQARLKDARAALKNAEADFRKRLDIHGPIYRTHLRALNKNAGELAQAYADHLVKALPHHAIEELPEDERHLAQAMADIFDQQGDKELADGILEAKLAHYVYHQNASQVAKGAGVKSIKSSKNVANTRRKMRGWSVSEANLDAAFDGKDPVFTHNTVGLIASRIATGDTATAAHTFHTALLDNHVAEEVKTQAALQKILDEAADERGGSTLYTMNKNGIKILAPNLRDQDGVREAEQALKDGKSVMAIPEPLGDYFFPDGKFQANDPRVLSQFVDKAQFGYRQMLTLLNVPAYSMRNAVSDIANALLAKTSMVDLKDALRTIPADVGRHREQTNLFREQGASKNLKLDVGQGYKLPAHQVWKEFEEDGASPGFYGGQGFEATHVGGGRLNIKNSRASMVPTILGGEGFHPIHSLRQVDEQRERTVRFATYLGARRRGMTRGEAAAYANFYHIDYATLSPTESFIRRYVMPFYTWTARNTRIQLRGMLENPGFYSHYNTVRQDMAKQAGLPANWESQLPVYQRRGAPIPIPGSLFGRKGAMLAFPQLPAADISNVAPNLGYQANMNLSRLFGPAKTSVELATNHSFFFGNPIYRSADEPDAKHWVPGPDIGGLSKRLEALGIEKQVIDPNTGKKVPMTSAALDYVLRSFSPQANFGLQITTPRSGSRNQTPSLMALSQISGVKFGPWNKAQNDLNRAYQEQGEDKAKMNDLRDLGEYYAPDGRHPTEKLQAVRDHAKSVSQNLHKAQMKQGTYKAPHKPLVAIGKPIPKKRVKKPKAGSWGGSSGGFGGGF